MNLQVQIAPAAAELPAIIEAAGRQIPPLWPLASQVAVNPYLGQAGLRLAETAATLGRIGGGPLNLPRAWYLRRLADGGIADADLAEALAASPYAAKPASLAALQQALRQPRPAARPLPTLAELAAAQSGTDWPGVIEERLGAWAASHFDEGQGLWAAPGGRSAWTAWRLHATHDIAPEILGLKGFASFVAAAPESAIAAVERGRRRLGLADAALASYFHQLLLSLGGWAQLARWRLWQAELAADSDPTLAELLAIRLLWEEALYLRHEAAVAPRWAAVRDAHATPATPDEADVVDEILQEAAERAAQRTLARQLAQRPAAAPAPAAASRPRLQAAFCIDVRSEVFRRALESLDPGIRTLGFAGFFGLATQHRRFGSDVAERRLPVLLNPTLRSCATGPDQAAADRRARLRARATRAWGRFRQAAVSSFAFVEAMGPVYAAKLLRDALGLVGAGGPDDPAPRFDPALDLPVRIRAAEAVLRAMSLTGGFAPVVLLVGHGAQVANNPHASGLRCGACGGYSGEVNARLLALLLNDPEVRAGLAAGGIAVPADTLFVAALHDTTSDAVTLFGGDAGAAPGELEDIRGWLAAAGRIARGERAMRLPRAGGGRALPRRARDWAQTRPEWGLAGCQAFIAAPRQRTAGLDLGGRVFLHDYDWRPDGARGYPVLELILTAPVVVASWISLQYYGSTVAPQVFGAGSKLLHNVVGGVGVLEGNGGLLRAGLPWQSVHDGEDYVHEPLRLTVCIEAPREAIAGVLRRHAPVRTLFDRRWLHLLALDGGGRLAWRYAGDLSWSAMAADGDA